MPNHPINLKSIKWYELLAVHSHMSEYDSNSVSYNLTVQLINRLKNDVGVMVNSKRK